MSLDQTSLPESWDQIQQIAASISYPVPIKKGEENFIKQMMMYARKEWETFHRQHPHIDEETFYEAQRFCVKQWLLYGGEIVLCDLPAFERVKKHLNGEVKGRAIQLETISMMNTYIHQGIPFLGDGIAAKAHLRSTQARAVMEELSSKKVVYLVDKVNRLRASGQAQDRAEEAAVRVESVRQDIKDIKRLAIAIIYENLKETLQVREKEVVEQLNNARQLVQESHHQSDTVEYITKLECYRMILCDFIEDINSKTIGAYHMQDTEGTRFSDWDAATQRAKDIHGQLQTFAGFIGGIQEAITEALASAKAEIAQVNSIQQRAQKAKRTFERKHKQCAEVGKWIEKEKNKIEARKKQTDSEAIIKKEEKLFQTIKVARSKTKKAIETYKHIYTTLSEMKVCQVKIAQRHVKFVKSLEKVKDALERAAYAAQRYAEDAKHACDQRTRALTLPVGGAEAQKAQDQARRTAQEEMQAYSSAKTAMDSAICYLREIASEQRSREEQAKIVVQHFTAVLQSHLPSEKDMLQSAITGVKNIVKVAMNVIKQEKNAQKAARQTAVVLNTAGDASPSRLIACEQEALQLAAVANDALAQCVAFYSIFHKLAVDAATEYLETMQEQFLASLEVVNTYLDEIKQEKDEKVLQCQRAASADSQNKAHLLVDEQTGAIAFTNGVTAFYLQDLAGIAEVPPKESGQNQLLFKDGHTWSSYDVTHDLLYEMSDKRSSIHLQVPDVMGGQVAMLSLPNGTQIKLTDIDLDKIEYDPVRPERGVSITLKQDGGKINLLAAAFVMRELTQEALLELVDKSLDKSIDQIRGAIGMKSLETIDDAFEYTKLDDIKRKYLNMQIISSECSIKRAKKYSKWIESICDSSRQITHKLREYADEVVKNEHGYNEINYEIMIKNFFSGNIPDDMYQKRDACLKKIATGKGLNKMINCQLFEYPEDELTAENVSINILDLLIEYQRAKAWQLAEQSQDSAGDGRSEKWTRYLSRLRRIILDQAPSYFRSVFLIYQIREAVEMDNLKEGTLESPGVTSLVKELAGEPSGIGGQGSGGDNDYAMALQVLMDHAVEGIQEALKTADPWEIISKTITLDFVFRVIEYGEARIKDALSLTTPTAMARLQVAEIGDGEGKGEKVMGYRIKG